MAYKIEYGMENPVVSSTKIKRGSRKRSPKKWIVLSLIVALIAVCWMTDILIPGDAAVTKAAMNDFVSDIKGGEQVVDAFAAFCQTVLQGG